MSGPGQAARLVLAISLTLLTWSPVAATTTAVPDPRPDIVVIMLDDVAADVVTRLLRRMPTLGRMFIDEGMTFPEAYGQDPLCCPGRVGFLTGLTTDHHGVRDNTDPDRFRSGMTVATALQDAGYHTMIAGKYLNRLEAMADATPPGWSRMAITSGGYQEYRLMRDGAWEWRGSAPSDYSTDVLADATAAFLRDAPADRPRFLSLNPYATHGDDGGGSRLPLAAPRHRGDPRCAGIGFRRTAAWNVRPDPDRAPWLHRLRPMRWLPESDPRGWPLRRACEALLSVDDWVRRVVDLQRSAGRLDRTMFLLTADNGMGWGDQRQFAKRAPWTTRIPLSIHWPAMLGRAATVNRTVVQNIDLAPTIVDIAGARLGPYPGGPRRPDGVSILSTIASPGGVVPVRSAILEQHRSDRFAVMRWVALRTTGLHPCGRWRFVLWADGTKELFDSAADRWELDNVAAERPALVRRFARELRALRRGEDLGFATCDTAGQAIAPGDGRMARWRVASLE